jgi:hypothetical protein
VSQQDGTFATPLAARGAVTLSARHPRYAQRTINIVTTNLDDIRVTLSTGCDLVLEPVRAGCARGEITVTLHTPCGDATRSIRADNLQTFSHLCAGSASLVLRADGCVPVRVAETLRQDRPTTVATIELVPGGAAEGRVVDATGTAVPGATVTDADDDLAQSVRTDRAGHFIADALREGDRRIVARHPVLGASEPVSVRVLRGTTLRGIELRFLRSE